MAEQIGISTEELSEQLALQDAMDLIPFADLDPGYAEDGSELGTDFGLWYRSAQDPGQQLLEAMARAGVLEYVTFEKVPLSLEVLVTRAEQLADDLEERRLEAGVTIDTALGGVVLHPYLASNPDQTEVETIAAGTGLPFQWGDGLPDPATIGGRNIEPSGCTTAFVVGGGAGNRRVLTAGHCRSIGDSVDYGGYSGYEVKTRSYDEFHDDATIDKPGVSWEGIVKYSIGGNTRNVDGVEAWSSMDVGDPVSKYGRTTGYTAGSIVNVHGCSPAGCDPESWFVRVDPNDPYPDMCRPGDSGGPNMWNLDAFGITSGYFPAGDCVFAPVQGGLMSWGHVVIN